MCRRFIAKIRGQRDSVHNHKMGKPHKLTPPPVKRLIRSCSGDKKLHAKDSQDLPNGWILEVRHLKSGRAYKCYISPTGSKFYSKQQISRHLKGEPSRKSKSRKTGYDMQSTSKAIIVRDTEEFPPGWTTQIIPRPCGVRRDAYYTDPVSGYVFRSKVSVFRYLKSGEIGRLASKPKKRDNLLELTDEIITSPTVFKRQKLEGSAARGLNGTSKRKRILESSVPEESKSLPENTSLESDEWPGLGSLAFVEDDEPTRKLGSKKKTVSAFPAARDSGKQQQFEKGVEGLILALPSVVVSNKKQNEMLQDAGSNARQRPKLRSRRETVPASPAARDSHEKLQQEEKGVENGIGPPTVVVSPKQQQQQQQQRKLEGSDLNEMQGMRLRSRKETALTPAAAVSPEKQQQQQLVKGAEKAVFVQPTVVLTSDKQQQKVEDADSNKTQERKLRAKRAIVSALPGGFTPEKRQLKKVEKVVPAQPTVKVSPNKQQQKPGNRMGKRGNRETQHRLSSSKDEKKLNLPRRASKRLAGVNADPMPELVIHKLKSQVSAGVDDSKEGREQFDQGGSSPEGFTSLGASEAKAPSDGAKTLDKVRDRLQTDGIFAEASRPQRTEEVNQKPESSLHMPFGDTWLDPCLEFAFKTLTGEIPVDENLVMQDYFQPQLSSVPSLNASDLALPDTSMDAFRQTDDLLRFDAMERPAFPLKSHQNKTVFPASTSSGNIISFGKNENTLDHSTSHENILSFGRNAKRQPSTRGTNAKNR